LQCGDIYIVIGHLVEGSVRVSEGEDVQEGAVIAAAGNSCGRSDRTCTCRR